MVWEKARVGGTPHPYFGARESKENWNFCRKSSIGRYTGVQHCSAGPAQRRQKYPKIGQISGFLIFLDRIWVRGPPPYFGAVKTIKIGHILRKTPVCRLFEFWEKTAPKIIGEWPNLAYLYPTGTRCPKVRAKKDKMGQWQGEKNVWPHCPKMQ